MPIFYSLLNHSVIEYANFLLPYPITSACQIWQMLNYVAHFEYLYFGLEGYGVLVPWMWTALSLMVVAAILMVNPITRRNDQALIVACVALFIETWIDKGMGLVTGGFILTPLHDAMDYLPTAIELLISLGLYAIGAFIIDCLI